MDVAALSAALTNKVLRWGTLETNKSNNYKGPLLLFKGELSRWVVEERHIDKILYLFPHAEIVKVQKAAHSPHKDNPKIIIKYIVETVKTLAN